MTWQRTVVCGAAGFTPNGVAFDAGNIYGAINKGAVYKMKPQ